MAGETLDAYLTFTTGRAGRGPAPEIKGETKDLTEKSAGYSSMQIKNYSLDFELETSGTEETSNQKKGELTTHQPNFRDVKITKVVDIASPYLLNALCTAAIYDKVWISQRKSGASKDSTGDYFWEIELRDVTVSTLTWGADESGVPTENLTLKYNGITAWYTPQKRTGELDLGNAVEYDYDLQAAKPGKDRSSSGMNGSDVDAVVKQVMALIAKANPSLKLNTRT